MSEQKAQQKKNVVIDWAENKFAPFMNKVTQNPWIGGVANTFTRILPFIFTGSLIFLYNVFQSYFPSLPSLEIIKNFSFGFLSIYVAFLVPYLTMESLKENKYQIQAGLLGISVFILVLNPTFDENSMMTVGFGYFGPVGMFIAIVTGLYTSCIYHNWVKHHFFEKSTSLPDFFVDWINNMFPIVISLAIEMIVVILLKVDVVSILMNIFTPISAIAQSYIGLILLVMIPCLVFSVGISAWPFAAVSTPIYMAGIAANIAAVAAGKAATCISTSEAVFTAGLITLGGVGCTLPLVVLSIFKAKSKRLKTLGKVTLVPSLFNINEPVVYGFPIAFNATLMVPMWLCSFVGATIEYIVMRAGLLNIPAKMIQVAQVPAPFGAVMITQDWRAVIWWAVLWIVYTVIWYPFFHIYDKKCLEEELKESSEAVTK